jgi:hypothetical protein
MVEERPDGSYRRLRVAAAASKNDRCRRDRRNSKEPHSAMIYNAERAATTRAEKASVLSSRNDLE